MANLIIKPASNGSLILQDEGGDAAVTVGTTGSATFAQNATFSGTANAIGTVATGNISNSAIVYPAGHVVRTTQASHDAWPSGHVSTSNTSATASGLIITTPATTGSNYNVITWSGSSYTAANQDMDIYLYSSKNGASYAQATGGDESGGMVFSTSGHRRSNMMWIDDSTGLTAGNNLYQIYFKTNTGTCYLVHGSYDYNFIVQEIKV